MSWNLSYNYSCIEFRQVVTRSDIRSMLSEQAPIILEKHFTSPTDCSIIEEAAVDYQRGSITYDEALEQVTASLCLYVGELQATSQGTTVIIRSEYDSDYSDSDIANEIAKHLFVKSGGTHFIVRSAAFDKCGGYSHQWIGYAKDDEIILRHTDEYFQEIFAN